MMSYIFWGIVAFIIWRVRKGSAVPTIPPPTPSIGPTATLTVTMNNKTIQVDTPRQSEKERMREWASQVLANKSNYVILDTETTGLKTNDVIVQIAIIDLDGNTLLDTLIKPKKRKSMSTEVTEIHGITFKDLKNAPTLADIAEKIEDITTGKTVLIYNAEYDERLLEQSCEQDSIDTFFFRTECVMEKYSEYVGQWNSYYGNYRWQKLPSGDHTAIGDCRATLKVIEKMSVE